MEIRRNMSTLVAAVAVGSMAGGAFAVDLTVANAGMESNQGGSLIDGQDRYVAGSNPLDAWKNWNLGPNGAALRGWNPGTVQDTGGVYDVGWGGNAPEGNSVIVIYTRYNDDRGVAWDDDGDGIADYEFAVGTPRDFESIAQMLTDTFDPTSRYILTAQVGQLGDDSRHGTGTEQYNGYNAALMAGGYEGWGEVVGANSASFNNWVGGSSMIAEDANSVAVPDNYLSGGSATGEGGWATTTVAYTPSPGTQAAMSALAGEQLVIRLSALEDPLNHATTSYAAFDDVKLTMIKAGDADEDDDVDSDDFNLLAFNFGAAGTWAEGDFDGDGTVDSDDFNLLAFNFGFGAPPPTPEEFAALDEFAASIAVPEPGSMALLGLGGLALMARRRRSA